MSRRFFVTGLVGTFVIAAMASRGLSIPTAFTINSGSSSLALSGDVAGNALSQQTSGSLATTYSGTINTDLTATTIAFLSPSIANAALQSQNQQPDDDGFGSPGSAPADYGFQFNSILGQAKGAVRELALSLTSSPLTITAGSFPSTVSIASDSGVVDYNAGVGGQQDLSGNSGGNSGVAGTLQTVGSIQTLTLPVSITYTDSILTSNDTQLTLAGTIVATRVVPEPTGLLFVTACCAIVSTRRRSR